MISRHQAKHWHPEAFDEPCAHDGDPSTAWHPALTVLFLAVGLVVAGYLVLLAVTAL